MSTTRRQILEKANAAISRGDIEGFLVHCTEDTVWRFLGDKTLEGKDAVRAWMRTAYREPPRFKVERMISDGEFLAAIGEIEVEDEGGRSAPHDYCDVWRFRDDKLAELRAYVVKKSP